MYRLYDRDTGKAIADQICLYDEVIDDSKSIEIFHPLATWKRKVVNHFKAVELLKPIFIKGKKVYDEPCIEDIKDYCEQQVDTLWDEVKRFENPHRYYVDLSQKLWDIKKAMLDERNIKFNS